ncbi:phosphoglucosamine mutase [Tautonia plasticadhaerens]|uniref:Phosphoglucosamine mutase n=1 Tax=Tautonia plasticadhaerens TaxID=2527974 RepID=A0A518HBL3_9BACT|nr:phosphoglucosamine mutase [Tautonia plasticadhaerens]QDV38207.1 Phosphoglucosamine mutase [Tautonia plasticadhaerens]
MGTRIASISGLRGIVGDGLDPVDVTAFAASYAAEVVSRSGKDAPTVLVGHDARRSAEMMLGAVLSGLSASGCHAASLGPTATPTIGFLIRDREAAGGIQISASHNPAEYNGLKFFRASGSVLGPDEGRAVLDRFERRAFRWVPTERLGTIDREDRDSTPDVAHAARVLGLVDAPTIMARRFRVVLDANHGAGGGLASWLLRQLNCDLRLLGGEPDGRYDHPPEPTEENLEELTAIVPAIGADIGFAQDPDADRLAIVDEAGRYIGEELTLALAVRHRLGRREGPVVMNLSTSRVAEEIARGLGCEVIRTPVGEIHVVEAMQAADAVIGGEGNGGVIDPRVGWVRDSLVGMALVLDLMASTGRRLSALVDELPKYAMVKTKFPVGPEPIAEILGRIASAHPEASADRRDGLRLDWPDAWAHVRASNTEPIVRVIAEAGDPERARALAGSLGRLAGGGGPS